MRSPLALALLFSLLLAGWLASRPIQELLAGDAADPAASAPAARAEPPPMTVLVAESHARPIAPELVVNGRTAPVRSVRIRVEIDGRVVETPVAEGSLVEAGAVLARLDVRDRESRVREMRALVAQRAIEDAAAQKLGAKRFQAETRVAEARAQLEAARSALLQAELDLARTEIKAPFAGVLESRAVEVGDFVDVGEEAALVIEQDPYLVAGDAPESLVARFAPGAPGSARLADGAVVQGRIRYVATQAEPATRTFRVELEVPNPAGRWFPAGMSARIVVREPEVLAHRLSAAVLVLADDGTVGIKAVAEDGTVRFHQARIVKAETDAVWLGGLPERLRVITTGQGFVAPGERVEVATTPPPEPAS
jgi:multidrug efflux system membrane fusion protein